MQRDNLGLFSVRENKRARGRLDAAPAVCVVSWTDNSSQHYIHFKRTTMQGASFFMSRNSSNIISFDGSSRASSRASRNVVESRAARYDESASMRVATSMPHRVVSALMLLAKPLPLAGSIIPNRSIRFQATVSPAANVLDSRKSRVLDVSSLSLSRLPTMTAKHRSRRIRA